MCNRFVFSHNDIKSDLPHMINVKDIIQNANHSILVVSACTINRIFASEYRMSVIKKQQTANIKREGYRTKLKLWTEHFY